MQTTKRERIFLGLLVVLSASTLAMTAQKAPQPARKAYVRNLENFRLHTEIHRQNVVRLGLALYDYLKDSQFKNVSRRLLVDKLRLHDRAKLASVKELRSMGYDHNSSLGERLFDYYGKDIRELSPAAREQFQALIDELNYYDGLYELDFYKRNGLINEDSEPNLTAKEIAVIEKEADLTERENNPISLEEFHRDRMIPAEDFFSDPREKTMARYLQEYYNRTFHDNPLEQRTQAVGSVRLPLRCHEIYVN